MSDPPRKLSAGRKPEKLQPHHVVVRNNTNPCNSLLVNQEACDSIMSLVNSIPKRYFGNVEQDRSLQSDIIILCQSLRSYGECLDHLYPTPIGRLFFAFQRAEKDNRLEKITRTYLHGIIDLRQKNWIPDGLSACCMHNDSVSSSAHIADKNTLHSATLSHLGGASVYSTSGTSTLSTSGASATAAGGSSAMSTSGASALSPMGTLTMSISGASALPTNRASALSTSGASALSISGTSAISSSGASDASSNIASALSLNVLHRHSEVPRLTGAKASVHSSSSLSSDENLTEVTVDVDGCILKLIGSDPKFVKTAKLVLDAYFSMKATPEELSLNMTQNSDKRNEYSLPRNLSDSSEGL